MDSSHQAPTHTPQWLAYSPELYTYNCENSSNLPFPQQDTQACYYDSRLAVAHIKDYRFIPKGDEQALADAVATIGPITVAIDADHASFLFYSSGCISILQTHMS